MKSREIHLVRHFTGEVKPEYFTLAEVELPEPADGEVLVANEWLSVDPYMRPRMAGLKTYIDPFMPGKAMEGGAVGKVIKSRSDALKEGDYVMSMFGWREAYVAPAKGLMKVDANLLPAHAYLGIAGLTGLTAYAGLKRIIGLKEGETLWMSAGAGAVGSAGIQFAKVMGARVIATAGGKTKTDFCLEIGADAAIDYKAVPDLRKAVKDAAPEGIDAYFENVGGDHLVAALDVLKQFGRIAACGMISRYNDEAPSPGPHNMTNIVTKSLMMRGFIVTEHFDLQGEFIKDLSSWMMSGKVKSRETVYEGIEKMPEAFTGLFTGANLGKMLVKV
ncbi:NADP-dependent oxidoreductase [Synechococcus moorigangaii CMS01]|nr:NADP-dependent oxidoreductase [Synechococcus moorigangaii CMS01]